MNLVLIWKNWLDNSEIVVLGSKEDIEQANQERNNFLSVTQVL